MRGKQKKEFWTQTKAFFQSLGEEMKQNSVAANAGKIEPLCCHMPEEELDKKRAEFTALAQARSKRLK